MNRHKTLSKFSGGGKIFIISGPSGSGKTTLSKRLLAENLNLIESISVTTREKKKKKKQGIDYIFVSKKMFLYKQRFGHFLESEKVFDNYYGTPYKNIRELIAHNKNVLLCIDVKGARTVCKKFPKAIRIFIKTSSLKELKKRLESRGSENKSIVRQRLLEAKKELLEAKFYDYIVVNDNLKEAFLKLKKIILKEIKF